MFQQPIHARVGKTALVLRVRVGHNQLMSATAKKAVRRSKASRVSGRAGASVTARKAGGRFTKLRAAKKKAGGAQAVRQPKSGARLYTSEKAADAAARRRIAATLDIDAFAATLPTTAKSTAKHWATPD